MAFYRWCPGTKWRWVYGDWGIHILDSKVRDKRGEKVGEGRGWSCDVGCVV